MHNDEGLDDGRAFRQTWFSFLHGYGATAASAIGVALLAILAWFFKGAGGNLWVLYRAIGKLKDEEVDDLKARVRCCKRDRKKPKATEAT